MDDAAIIRMLNERDERAVSAAVEKYQGYCMAIALNILGSREDAEECVNDAFLKVWEQSPTSVTDNLRAFLGRLTRNSALNMIRDAAAQKRGGGGAELVFDEIADTVPSGANVERDAENRELIGEINRFLKKLPAVKRNIFICRYWYCDSVREIAAQFSMSENNVSVTLNRIRRRLREHLRKRGYDYDE